MYGIYRQVLYIHINEDEDHCLSECNVYGFYRHVFSLVEKKIIFIKNKHQWKPIALASSPMEGRNQFVNISKKWCFI